MNYPLVMRRTNLQPSVPLESFIHKNSLPNNNNKDLSPLFSIQGKCNRSGNKRTLKESEKSLL